MGTGFLFSPHAPQRVGQTLPGAHVRARFQDAPKIAHHIVETFAQRVLAVLRDEVLDTAEGLWAEFAHYCAFADAFDAMTTDRPYQKARASS